MNTLGYDPCPNQQTWHGTPIPDVAKPLPATPELIAIARSMWWNGEPWTILRNRSAFLRHAADYATDTQCRYLWQTIDRDDWIAMLRATQPGQMSMRAYRFWMWRAGLLDERLSIPKEWHVPRHIKDLIHVRRRPLSVLRRLMRETSDAS